MATTRDTKPWALRRALQGSELLLDAESIDPYLSSAVQAFAHHGNPISPGDYEYIENSLRKSHAKMAQDGYDLGHAIVGIRQGSDVVAGTHLFGYFGQDDRGGQCAMVNFTGTFALPERDALITERYGQRIQPAIRAEVGETLLAYYSPHGIAVEFVAEPANPALHEYYALQGFADTDVVGCHGTPIMVLPVNPETIGHLADLARGTDWGM